MMNKDVYTKSRAIAGRTTRCRWKFRYISNFTTASCCFSSTAPFSCIGLQSLM